MHARYSADPDVGRLLGCARGKTQNLRFGLAQGGGPAPVLELAFNPADNTLAVCTSQSLAVHDPRTGTELTRILQSADHFALSSDGMLIATTDSTVLRVLASGSSPDDH
jgi:hypothetical protein